MNIAPTLFFSTLETLYMVIAACAISVFIGLPLGTYLFIQTTDLFGKRNRLGRIIGFIVNIVRSIPFIILMVAALPLTRWVVGTGIGTTAAIVPLSLAAAAFYTRVTESALKACSVGLIEASLSLGASTKQIIFYVLLPECRADLLRGATLMIIALIGYSAMAGAIGGGGLGSLAIQYGYQRFDTQVMVATIVILVLLVQCFQWIGSKLSEKYNREKA